MRNFLLFITILWIIPTEAQLWTEKEKWFSGISAHLEELDSEERDRLFDHSDSPEILLQIKRRRAFCVYTSSWASMTTILRGKVSYSGDSLSIYFKYRKITSDDVQIRIRGINGFRRIKNKMAVRRFNPEYALENLLRPKTTVKSVVPAFPSFNIILPLCLIQEIPDFFVLLSLMTKF